LGVLIFLLLNTGSHTESSEFADEQLLSELSESNLIFNPTNLGVLWISELRYAEKVVSMLFEDGGSSESWEGLQILLLGIGIFETVNFVVET